jgi:hypothetical protein
LAGEEADHADERSQGKRVAPLLGREIDCSLQEGLLADLLDRLVGRTGGGLP